MTIEAEIARAEVSELVAHEVLVVDHDPKVGSGLVQLLAPDGLHVTPVDDPAKASDLLATKYFGVVVIDLDTPGPNLGVDLVRRVHEASPTSFIVVLTARKSFDAAVTAFRSGAHDVVIKSPDQIDYLKERVLAGAGKVHGRGEASAVLGDLREALDEFLRRFMEAERRAQDLDDKVQGRDAARIDTTEMRVLVVDGDPRVFEALQNPVAPGFAFSLAPTGGEALDRVTSSNYQLAIVGAALPDLPASMVCRALKTQSPDLLVMTYAPRGKLELVEATRSIVLADSFNSIQQLTDRLGELAEVHRAKARERRYLQAFRERHYDFLRRFAELKRKLESL